MYVSMSMERLLVSKQLVTQSQIDALMTEATEGLTILDLVMREQLVDEDQLLEVFGEQAERAYINLNFYNPDAAVFHLLPEETAEKYTVMPLCLVDNALLMAMTNTQDIELLDRLSELTSLQIEPVVALEGALKKAIPREYARANGEKGGMDEGSLSSSINQDQFASQRLQIDYTQIDPTQGDSIVIFVDLLFE